MIPPADSLLRYETPVLVSRNTEKRSPKVSGQPHWGPRASPRGEPPPPSLTPLLSSPALSAGPAAEGQPAAAAARGARPSAQGQSAVALRRPQQASGGDPQCHPAAQVSVGLGEGAGRGKSTATLPPSLPLLLPFREWVEENQLWIQQVSSTPSTRMDVVHLQEQLDLKLQQRQARETGICPVRRELYSQCFGEHGGTKLPSLRPRCIFLVIGS